MSCRWHSPPSSHTGQSCGWLVISHSTTSVRNSLASGSSIEMRTPSSAPRHAGHHQPAARVVLVAVLLDRALAAGADRAQRRVPAEVRQVEAEREAGVRAGSGPSRPRRCGRRSTAWRRHRARRRSAAGDAWARRSRGLPVRTVPAAMWRSNSSRKYLSALCSGSTAPGASAQNVLPGPSHLQCLLSSSMSSARAPPSSNAIRIFSTQGRPSRHGVHQPHDSRAKKRSSVEHHADRAGLIVEHDQRCRCPGGCRPSGSTRSPSASRGARASGSRSRRRPAASRGA